MYTYKSNETLSKMNDIWKCIISRPETIAVSCSSVQFIRDRVYLKPYLY